MAKKLTEREKKILAFTLLGEAAGEGKKGMEAVAWVIRNRSESGKFSDNPAAVAVQKNGRGVHQFSTWNGNGPTDRFDPDSKEFKTALQAIDEVFAAPETADPTDGAIGYYASGGENAIAKPAWFDRAGDGEIVIGNHSFASNSEAKRLSKLRTDTDSISGRLPQDAMYGVGRFNVAPDTPEDYDPYAQKHDVGIPVGDNIMSLLRAQDRMSAPQEQVAQSNTPSGGLVSRKVHTIEIRADGTPVLTPTGKSWTQEFIDRSGNSVRINKGTMRTQPADGVREFELPRDYHPAFSIPAPQDLPPGPKPDSEYQPFKYEDRIVTTYERVPVDFEVTPQGPQGRGPHRRLAAEAIARQQQYKLVPVQKTVQVKVRNPVARPKVTTRPASNKGVGHEWTTQQTATALGISADHPAAIIAARTWS